MPDYFSKSAMYPIWGAVIATSFMGGVGVATFMLRLRDRERLRQAASRTMKSLRQTQRAALGPQLNNIFASSSSSTKAPQKILVIGGGSYGTAMAFVASSNGHQVVMYMRDAKQCAFVNKHQRNPKQLSDYSLAPNGNAIRGICTNKELHEELAQLNIVVILALPCQVTPDWIRAHRDMIHPTALLCSTAKGLYLPTKQLIGHAILDALERAEQPLAFLSGPSFAEEIVKEFPTSVVVASDHLFNAVRIQKLLSNTKSFRVYTSQDPIGKSLVTRERKRVDSEVVFAVSDNSCFSLCILKHRRSTWWSFEESIGSRRGNDCRHWIWQQYAFRLRHKGQSRAVRLVHCHGRRPQNDRRTFGHWRLDAHVFFGAKSQSKVRTAPHEGRIDR